MSIWEKCREHNAVPFYGFPLKVSYKDGVITWEFPEGYNPNGSQVQEVAHKLREFVGGSIIEITDKKIKILAGEKHIAVILYQAFLDQNIMSKK